MAFRIVSELTYATHFLIGNTSMVCYIIYFENNIENQSRSQQSHVKMAEKLTHLPIATLIHLM